MDARRNTGHIVPRMTVSTNNSTFNNSDSSDDEIEEGQSRLQELDLNRQSKRMVGKNQKGRFEVPRTDCWKRFNEKPHKHVLNCGHVTTTETRQACGINCRLSKKAKNTPHGSLIKCDTCIEKRKQAASPLMPRKKARRFSNPESRLRRMSVDDSEVMFADNSAIVDDEELLLRQQLDDAGYNRPRRSSIIESPRTPTPNPRKRRAVEEPDFHLPDHPTGEKPKRRRSARVSNNDELAAIRKYAAQQDQNACICRGDKDEELLECVWCHRNFHPTCAGHGKLNRYEHSTYDTGQREFCCEECQKGLADAELREAAEKKARQAKRGRKKTTAAEVMAEVDEERQSRRLGKQKHKHKSKKHIAKGERKDEEEESDDEVDGIEVEEPTTPKSILRRRTSNPPPPANVRFSLSENRVSRKKSMESMEIDD